MTEWGSPMEIGTDTDGRAITLDEVTGQLMIGGIAAPMSRLVAYDRGRQVSWASESARAWAYDYARMCAEQTRQAHAAEPTAPQTAPQTARERPVLRARGYDPEATVRLADTLKGLGVLIVVLSGMLGLTAGFALGTMLSAAFPPVVSLFAIAICCGAGLALGYLGTLGMRVVSDLLLTGVQIEMNTRRPQ